MDVWALVNGHQVLEQITPATQATILLKQSQGYVFELEHGQAKNQPVSFVNAWRETNKLNYLVFRSE